MVHRHPSFSFEVRSARHLAELAAAPFPPGVKEGRATTSQHRDLYLDTEDDMLRRRGITCRLRLSADDTRRLTLLIASDTDTSEERFDSAVQSPDPAVAIRENSSVGRRLAALVDPARLAVKLEVQTDRTTRLADRDWMRRPRVELHYDRAVARRDGIQSTVYKVCVHARNGNDDDATRLAAAMEAAHGLRATTERTRERAELLLRWKHSPEERAAATERTAVPARKSQTEFINPELSLLAFQSRVLSLAENPATPLLERLKFLSIVSSNLDEFFMIRVAGLRQAAEEQSGEQCDDGLTRAEQMQVISSALDELANRQSACAAGCLRELEKHGTRLMKWDDLPGDARDELRRQCIEEIQPDLTPMAMTLSPGHPMPHLPHLTLALAVARRDPETRRLHLAELELPSTASRFFRVPGAASQFITLEEVVRSNIDLAYPAGGVEAVSAFRVTRGGELSLDEEAADDLVEAISYASGRRSSNPAVRIEVERDMPQFMRDLLVTNLQREDPDGHVNASDIRDVDGLLDLTCLSRLDIPSSFNDRFPAFEPGDPIAGKESLFDEIRASDLLCHHPFDSFDATVLRFLDEAASDPDVTTIRITLYRLGSPSPVADTLIRAAKKGKKVIAFVELKARFDEEHNVGWARKLEKAGGHVISGLVGVKNHAKAAMVVRREGQKLQSYVHVGTGNYNARSARDYTDFSLFSARDDLTQDVADLFNSLTGGSLPPRGLSRGSLVAPHQMADTLIAMIDREAANARAGRTASIVAKVNGLSDPAVVRALLRASSDGVTIDVICRGICTLRPGLPQMSDRIRVLSHVGRFLEHSRVYRFANAGDPVHFIGSADLRHRNLRRRVELLVPVHDERHKAGLDRILDTYLDDKAAWHLSADGEYRQSQSGLSLAQQASTGHATWQQ